MHGFLGGTESSVERLAQNLFLAGIFKYLCCQSIFITIEKHCRHESNEEFAIRMHAAHIVFHNSQAQDFIGNQIKIE